MEKRPWAVSSNKISEIKNSFSNGLGNAYSTVTNILGNIKNKFSNIMDSAKNIVSNVIDKIKSFFNFSWSLPHLKLPHISISGSFSINPPSVPHFGISWYKKAMDDGMIMNQPTIFGYNAKSNQFLAGGEAGSETVVGTQSLMDMIRVAVDRNNADLIDEVHELHVGMNNLMELLYNKLSGLKVVMDTGELVGVLTDHIDEALGKEFRRKSVGDRIYL